ncbi:MAG: hypothetical protein K2Q17_14910 [Nitrospiraceae bacterium]|jgi:hypothetical protein|uniref:hypothetical protein n=1 Tax=Nitrospira cf. moscoviensis SBR1015 TaxID=96242 RepID=UPI000A0E3837|nr:hypothetical protein [Nitrospira cf. moscoviensis SBR1015]MBY0248950.1 hypothetical protein [Nitrospiraceae bacterium]OQW37753.1 MAG: hypothetical protein A4E20_17600 [Nitrospira sp. SG-bin2]
MKQRRKGSGLLLGLLWLLIADVATAGDYTLVVGKAAAVCQHMLKILSEDLKAFGELKYDQHEEFTAIEWTLALDDYCRRDQLAQFDIDNDGHDDTVLKNEGCLRGVLDDSIFIYTEGKNAPQPPPHFVFDVSVAKRASGLIGQFPQGRYELRKLPKFREGTAEFYRHVGGLFRMNPFRFSGRYYVVIDNPFQQPDKGGKRFTAIVSYEKDGHLTDVCYFATRTFIRRDADVID